jgi:hypothetical protein
MFPKFGDRLIVVIKQGEAAGRAFNTADRTIDNITTTIVFSYSKLNPYREIAKEQEQTDYSFIYLCGGDLRPLNYKVVPVHRVFRYVGIDVTSFMDLIEGGGAFVLDLWKRVVPKKPSSQDIF